MGNLELDPTRIDIEQYQPPAISEAEVNAIHPNRLGQLANRIGLTGLLAAGALVVVGAGVRELATPDSASAAQARVVHRDSKLITQDVLNDIHTVLHPLAGDSTQDGACQLKAAKKLHLRCSHDQILPTSAYLKPSEGGFNTNCKDPKLITYAFYKINRVGTAAKACIFLYVKQQRTTLDEFQSPLNKEGDRIARSVGLHTSQTVDSVGGNRRRVVTQFDCATPGNIAGSGVREIVLIRRFRTTRHDGKNQRVQDSRATIGGC